MTGRKHAAADTPLSTERAVPVPGWRAARPRPRRGVALLAAMWLVVIIATVALQFSLTARERVALGQSASDRTRDRASAAGALATMLARLDFDLRNRATQANTAALRSSDPWLGIDSVYSGDVMIGEHPVRVAASDLGATLNINLLSEVEIRQLFSFVLRDYQLADRIAQSIVDWIDADDLPRAAGAEREQYIRDGLMVLPTNGPFREVDDLIHVSGMTPEILLLVRPFLTTYGFGARVNVNTAPEAVLRALPGMTDVIVANILGSRSAGRRITSINELLGAVAGAGRPRGNGGGRGQPVQPESALAQRITVDTRDVQLTLTVRDTLVRQPTRLVAIVQRSGNNSASVRWQQW